MSRMMRRSVRAALSWLSLAALAACAAPQATAPPPVPAPGAVAPVAPAAEPEDAPFPPSAETLASFPLVREHPGVAAATAALGAAPEAARPTALMSRAREAVAAGHRMRLQPDGPFFVPSLAPDYPRYLAFYELAERDLAELLALHAGAPEAAEALFTTGLIRDYPHLERFDEALAAYRATVERHPGSVWAGRARERARALEEIMRAGTGGPHGAPPP